MGLSVTERTFSITLPARRGVAWGVYNHHAVVADDYAGVRVSLCGEGPKALADFRERDFLLAHVALRSECLAALCL